MWIFQLPDKVSKDNFRYVGKRPFLLQDTFSLGVKSVHKFSVFRKKDIFRCEIFSFMRQCQYRWFPFRGKKTFSVARYFPLWDNISADNFRSEEIRLFPLRDIFVYETISAQIFSVVGEKRHFLLGDIFHYKTISVKRYFTFSWKKTFYVARYFQF